MYKEGKGVPQDYHKMMEYAVKASNQGNSQAQCDIGNHSSLKCSFEQLIIDLSRNNVLYWRKRDSTRL